MTLEEMLQLLPDNTSGQIGADDLRAIVTGLYRWATMVNTAYAYQWANTTSPTSGRVSADGWTLGAHTLYLNETSGAGEVLTFSVVDAATASHLWLSGSGKKISADITGPSVDQGVYRTLPINVTEVVGAQPSNNENLTLTIVAATS